MSRKRSPKTTARPLSCLITGIGLAAVLVIAIAALLIVLSQTSRASLTIPTVALLPSSTPGATRQLEPESSPTASPPSDAGRAMLPPTWTITPTRAASATPPSTATSMAAARSVATTFPTLSPQQLANTYWEGDGVDSMWDYKFEDGSFGRFAIFPVNIWVGAYGNVTLNATHEAAIENALAQIAPVVPVQRVENRMFAHMTIWLMDDAEFDRSASCGGIDMSIGCTSPTFTDAGIMLNTIWLRVTDDSFASTLLHETVHGLGIMVHSPHPEDLMYAFDEGQAARLTARDLNTLRALYSAPAFNPRGN